LSTGAPFGGLPSEPMGSGDQWRDLRSADGEGSPLENQPGIAARSWICRQEGQYAYHRQSDPWGRAAVIRRGCPQP